jgi:hypothetical protein
MLVRNANQLGEALKSDPAVSSCVVKRLLAFGAGRKVQDTDQPWIARLGTEFVDSGYRFKELLRSVATSDEFFSAEPPTRSLLRQEVARVN